MNRMHRAAATIAANLLLAILAVSVATAEELKTAPEIIEFSSAKTATYKTWSADYTESIRMMGNSLAIKGRVMQKLPGKMWMQMEMPMMGQRGKMTMILGEDGILWQISEMGAQPQIMKVDENRVYSNTTALAGAKFKPLELMDPSKRWETTRDMYDYKKVDAGEVDGRPVYVMEGVLKTEAVTNYQMIAEAARVGKVRVSIGQDDGFVRRYEQYDKSLTNVFMAMEFKNVKLNPDIPDSTFVYRPPTNAIVADLTQSIMTQIRAQEGAGTPPSTGSVTSPPAPPVPKTK